MLCINNPYIDPYFNLAAEEYLFKTFSENIFMLWQNEPTVVIGRHQNIRAEADLSSAKKKQIKIARRYTGGGAVYHDSGNINLTFIQNNIDVNFNQFSVQIINFLATLGIEAQTDERNGLIIDGLKISGSAQYIRKNRMIHHATLLFSSDLDVLTSILEAPPVVQNEIEDRKLPVYVKSVKSPVTNIFKHLSHPLDIQIFKNLILKFFLQSNSENQVYTLTQSDIAAIEILRQSKYATKEWILGR